MARCDRWHTLYAVVFFLAIATGQAAIAGDASPTAPAARVGKQIVEFHLRDYRGMEHALSDYGDKKLIVVAFLGVECPLVKLYGPRLEELADRYAPRGVAFLGINSNRQDPPTKINAFAQRAGIEFPILKDPDNCVADQFEAIRTPEVFVLDEKRVIRYWGRIDDQYGFTTGVGYGKKEVTRHDLVEALDELLADKTVSVAATPAPGCHIGRVVKVTPHGDVTYSNQISRIFNQRCVQCHRVGQIGPFPMATYDDVIGWGPMIQEVVADNRMPPWHANPEYGHFANDPRLTDDEKQLISTWVANGMPEGDRSQLPEPVSFAEGWGIPQPDAVYYIDETPYQVQAEGVVDYQYFVVDPGYTKDVWLKAFECRPGNFEVVHHIIAFIQEPSGKRTQIAAFRPGQDPAPPASVNGHYLGARAEMPLGEASARRSAQIGYAPGMPPTNYPPGWGLLVPAGSKFVFQMHYTATGTAQPDRSCLGVVFSDPSSIKHRVQGGVCGTVTIAIPPGDADYVLKSQHKLLRDTLIVGYMPHLHVRGTAFRYEVEYPDGRHQEILLDVPKYDFNWQLWYQPEKPVLLPKGSRLICTAHYDNSADNVYNPDPTATVRFGEQTWDEMMFGWYVWIDPHEKLSDPRDADHVAALKKP